MKKVIVIALLIAVGACTQVDDATNTTFSERCVAYRAALAGLVTSQAKDPSDARAARIAAYQAIADTCP